VYAYTTRAPDKTSENEDTVAVIPYGPEAAVLVVADGAGGLPAGKRASSTAVASLASSLHTSMEETMLLRTAILNGIDAANAAVQAIGNGSATTLTVITIEGRVARSYQVGDSEAMVVGQRGLIRLQTTPHSPTGFAVEAGFLDQKEALHHEDRYLVSNFLGTTDMRIDIGAEIRLQARDTVLLASDGLMDNVHVDEIIERIRKGPLKDAAGRVVSLAQRRMAGVAPAQPSKPDDLSLILFRKNPRVADKKTPPNLTKSEP
jgi:serine/threonine protein phosphatase PrpC